MAFGSTKCFKRLKQCRFIEHGSDPSTTGRDCAQGDVHGSTAVGGIRPARHAVPSRFVETSHEKPKLWHLNGRSRKFQIQTVQLHELPEYCIQCNTENIGNNENVWESVGKKNVDRMEFYGNHRPAYRSHETKRIKYMLSSPDRWKYKFVEVHRM